jgi:hypothetical protein
LLSSIVNFDKTESIYSPQYCGDPNSDGPVILVPRSPVASPRISEWEKNSNKPWRWREELACRPEFVTSSRAERRRRYPARRRANAACRDSVQLHIQAHRILFDGSADPCHIYPVHRADCDAARTPADELRPTVTNLIKIAEAYGDIKRRHIHCAGLPGNEFSEGVARNRLVHRDHMLSMHAETGFRDASCFSRTKLQ